MKIKLPIPKGPMRGILEYLQNCSRYHDNMLDTSSSECVCGDQLILNGNVDIYENKQHLDNWISDIDAFIKA